MMQSGKKEKKLQKTLDAFYMDGAAYLGKYIGMNAYKKSRMRNVLNAAGLKMTPETYMAYAYLKAGSIFSFPIHLTLSRCPRSYGYRERP